MTHHSPKYFCTLRPACCCDPLFEMCFISKTPYSPYYTCLKCIIINAILKIHVRSQSFLTVQLTMVCCVSAMFPVPVGNPVLAVSIQSIKCKNQPNAGQLSNKNELVCVSSSSCTRYTAHDKTYTHTTADRLVLAYSRFPANMSEQLDCLTAADQRQEKFKGRRLLTVLHHVYTFVRERSKSRVLLVVLCVSLSNGCRQVQVVAG